MFTERPCVGCGYCCFTATCSIGLFLFGENGLCPALKWNGVRYICALVDLYKNALAMGKGCCAPHNTWRERVRKRTGVYHRSAIRLALFASSPVISSDDSDNILLAASNFTHDSLINNITSSLE